MMIVAYLLQLTCFRTWCLISFPILLCHPSPLHTHFLPSSPLLLPVNPLTLLLPPSTHPPPGQLKQDSRTSNMIFTIPQMIASLSQGFTLKPGDVLLTGKQSHHYPSPSTPTSQNDAWFLLLWLWHYHESISEERIQMCACVCVLVCVITDHEPVQNQQILTSTSSSLITQV